MEQDKYSKFIEDEHIIHPTDLQFDRRDFLQITGAGIFVFFTIGKLDAALQRRRGRDYPTDFNAYLKISENGRISCFTGKIEMGQGIITSLAQMLADDLDVSLDSVDMVMGDTALCPYDGGTTGSRSTKYFGPPLRKAAAQARAVLLKLASEKLDIPVIKLRVNNGIIHDTQSQKKISYAELAHGQRIERLLPEVPIKKHSDHIISGRPTPKTDSLEKVTGAAKFTGDIQVPGMLHAKILRPPAHNAIKKNIDTSSVKNQNGAIVIHEKDLVAVLHEDPEVAEDVLKMIKAKFEIPDLIVDNQNIFDHLQKIESIEEVIEKRGIIPDVNNNNDHQIESVYYNHYIAHAPMEPHTAVAQVENDQINLWVSTQTPFRVQKYVADEFNVPVEKVHIITPFLGGGFGGKKAGSYIFEAVRLAKITGKPVQVAMSRKEEFYFDAFRPAAVIKLKSGMDKSGKIQYWHYDNFYAGSRSSEPMYDIPNLLVQSREPVNEDEEIHPFDVGAWRGPGSNTNVFAMESQIDIMAQRVGLDPLSFRLKNLTDQRMLRVLKAAAEKFGESFSKGPSGKGYGIACTNYLNTYVASIAQVSVDKSGNVTVARMVCAQDMGEIINPQGAILQIEGGLTMGLGYALSEEIQFKGGKILTENFSDYDFTRFSWSPKIDAVLIDNPDLAPQGCGEPAITTSGAVIANAIYDAIGVRMYTLPMTPERIVRAGQ
jgi:nicotinate dehydrogenase subunit B